ncbi:MAG: UDP-N-acetylmuramoyl-L-alanine--D-glutamate ligase [Clostridia bacterium]|nr:UDP-N-acetylmuramoyl-L-alanine--D-glutamate ligase [Clostridia bacterium]
MDNVRAFFDSLKGKEISVVGLGVSHRPLISLLVQEGLSVTAYDKKPMEELGDFGKEFAEKGVRFVLGEGYLDDLRGDLIFKTPGMRGDLPPFERARARGAEVTSEMEVFFRLCPCPIFAVTGSDGKTTTTTLISRFLSAQGKRCYLGGNIGKPLLPQIFEMTPDDVAVVELSSFQLNDMHRSAPTAVVTNVAPNHLDWHTDMAEYVNAKRCVFKHQTSSGRLVVNYDNEITRSYAKEAKGDVLYFSFKGPVPKGVYLDENGTICVTDGVTTEPIMHRSLIRIIGDHNVENYMAAIAATLGHVDRSVLRTVAETFGGVEHRMEFVREVDGVKWYNDSIASSPTRVIAGLKAQTQRIIMLAGGYDKKIPFEPMVPYVLDKVKYLILTGATAEKIRTAVTSHPAYSPEGITIEISPSWDYAIARAKEVAVEGDVVSLSPACASFDCFANFEVRGEYFKKKVNEF